TQSQGCQVRPRRFQGTPASLDPAGEQHDHEHPGPGAGEQRRDRREEPDSHAAHPDALSTRSTWNGVPPRGVTSNVTPQCPTIASAFDGGARLDSTPAANTAPQRKNVSPAMSRRSRTAAPAARSGRERDAWRRGFVRARFTAASSIAAASSAILTTSAWPYDV